MSSSSDDGFTWDDFEHGFVEHYARLCVEALYKGTQANGDSTYADYTVRRTFEDIMEETGFDLHSETQARRTLSSKRVDIVRDHCLFVDAWYARGLIFTGHPGIGGEWYQETALPIEQSYADNRSGVSRWAAYHAERLFGDDAAKLQQALLKAADKADKDKQLITGRLHEVKAKWAALRTDGVLPSEGD